MPKTLRFLLPLLGLQPLASTVRAQCGASPASPRLFSQRFARSGTSPARPGLSAATAASSAYQVFSRLAGSTELKVIVLGDAVRPGQLFTIPVGAVNRLSAYSVQIEQVADQADSLRLEVSSYKASLAAERN